MNHLKQIFRLIFKDFFVRHICQKKRENKGFDKELWMKRESSIFMHDIHEFCRVLLDNVETKLKVTFLESEISDLSC
jgi:hypothetical protein